MGKKRDKNLPGSTFPTRFGISSAVVLVLCHGAVGFNYDYSSACARPGRAGRAQAASVPCDLRQQSYCNLPGSAYPWHAVRRFVHENQGLMRRMYGDQRHISVLKAEIENNDIEADAHRAPARDDSYARFVKDQDILNAKISYSKNPTGRSDEPHTVPHFRPVQTTPTTTNSKENDKQFGQKKKQPTKSKLESENSSLYKENSDSAKGDRDEMKLAAYKTSFFEDEVNVHDISKDNLDMNKIEPEIVSLEAAIKQSIETNSVYPNYSMSAKNTSTYATSTQTIETHFGETTPSQFVTVQESTAPPESEVGTTTENEGEENGGWKPVAIDKMSTLPPTMLFSESVKHEDTSNDRIDYSTDENTKDSVASGSTNNAATTTVLESQLFQDVVQGDNKPVIKLRGVNACPVKEEVVAPFWANNTRGEVLALLNLYPFEQYVHWEKCTHEHKQMFCREGCRCEQQYRLHRLLAYDPNNECRGIFSDWFRFPSCCVCKCYDMPLEFRVTSRSPRTIEPEVDEIVKKEMYQQAASDWYTINLEE